MFSGRSILRDVEGKYVNDHRFKQEQPCLSLFVNYRWRLNNVELEGFEEVELRENNFSEICAFATLLLKVRFPSVSCSYLYRV